MKIKMSVALSVLLVAGLAMEASAKDVCLNVGGSFTLVLKKVKTLKASGAVALTGFAYYDTSAARPCEGSATMNAAGTIITAGVNCHGRETESTSVDFDWQAIDSTFAGTGEFSYNTNYATSAPVVITTSDCDTLTLP